MLANEHIYIYIFFFLLFPTLSYRGKSFNTFNKIDSGALWLKKNGKPENFGFDYDVIVRPSVRSNFHVKEYAKCLCGMWHDQRYCI